MLFSGVNGSFSEVACSQGLQGCIHPEILRKIKHLNGRFYYVINAFFKII
jgi:hypothetical protein